MKINSMSVQQRNLQLLLIEIYKTINNLNPYFLSTVILFYPKPVKTSMALILYGLLAQNYGRLCRKKSKSPRHWGHSKETSEDLFKTSVWDTF